MWKLLTVIVTKLILRGLRLFRRHATALPGLVAEQIYPQLLKSMAKNLSGVIIVTGTNGKTTTAKLIRKLLESQGKRVLANRSGSNFTRGILSSFIEHATWAGHLNFDVAVLEVDEAYTPRIAEEVLPEVMVVLNVMRDQLDRYGEIDHTAKTISRALQFSQGAVLNGDDQPVATLAKFAKKSTTFGVAPALKSLLPSDDELHAESAKPASAASKPTDVYLQTYDKLEATTTLKFNVKGTVVETSTMLEGVHSYVNIAAALATLYHLGGNLDQTTLNAVAEVKPAFGRGERLVIDNVPTHLALIKNPGGFNQNMRSFMRPKIGLILFIINDRIADGRDVSWLWDIDLSPLQKAKNVRVITSGIRAYDMAVRLQQEGLVPSVVEPKIGRALKLALSQVADGHEVLIMPTYTAMLEARKLLLRKQARQELWR